MAFDWNNDTFAEEYGASADDPTKNWYENEVNIPSLISLLPGECLRVLDFGCGPGNFTKQLSEKFDASGADASKAMIKLANQKFPSLTFFTWDGLERLPESVHPYDAIVTKLTLEFVSDLDSVAHNLRAAIRPNGWLVISVQHPLLAISCHPETNIPYWQTSEFDVQVGTTASHVTKVHRNLQNYIMPFLDSGFMLKQIDEPEVPKALAEKHHIEPIDFKIPKRLNVQFQAI